MVNKPNRMHLEATQLERFAPRSRDRIPMVRIRVPGSMRMAMASRTLTKRGEAWKWEWRVKVHRRYNMRKCWVTVSRGATLLRALRKLETAPLGFYILPEGGAS